MDVVDFLTQKYLPEYLLWTVTLFNFYSTLRSRPVRMVSGQKCLYFVFLSELSQGEAGVAFEVLAESRLVGEGEAVG